MKIIAFLLVFFTAPISIPTYGLYRLIKYLRKEKYFKSEEFLRHKDELSSTINEYNEISDYVNSFEDISLQASNVDRFKYSNLASYENTSSFNMNRQKNNKNLSSNVYQTSLSVVKKASEEPLKYLCKYFNFQPNEENLARIQEIGETVSRFINAKTNLDKRLSQIESNFNPPKFILKHYKDELLKKIEIQVPEITFNFPKYIFEYVSAGGNSSQKTTIVLDDITIESLIEYIANRVKYSKSAKAQRSLMTKKLRESIKERDEFTCQSCSASVAEQSLLLLEVDHIVPVSKGGLSTEDNLQTLCWKCNRSKSNKLI